MFSARIGRCAFLSVSVSVSVSIYPPPPPSLFERDIAHPPDDWPSFDVYDPASSFSIISCGLRALSIFVESAYIIKSLIQY